MSSSYSSLIEGSSLDGNILIFNCTPLLFSSYESSFFLFSECTESNHFLLEHIPWMNEFHDPRRPFKVDIITSTFFTFSFTASICSWFERLLWLHGLCILYLHILQLDSLVHIVISFFPSNSLKFCSSVLEPHSVVDYKELTTPS